MIRTTLLITFLFSTAAQAQDAADGANTDTDTDDAATTIGNAADEGVTGFVPLVAPALGAAAALVGVAAAGGGGSSSSTTTTSTTGTN